MWDFSSQLATQRPVKATLRASGSRTYIYVEDAIDHQIRDTHIDELWERLEAKTPAGSISPDLGLVPLEEKIFGPLPQQIYPDERLVVLITDLGATKGTPALFNPIDQISEEEAGKLGLHSNERNILYVNSHSATQPITYRAVARELKNLLAHSYAQDTDPWLAETLAESAVQVTGYAPSRSSIGQYTARPESHSLVSHAELQYGPQQLFASFLLDAMPNKEAGLRRLSRINGNGRLALEKFFQGETSRLISFDLLFSNFVGYLFGTEGKKLPASLRPGSIIMPRVKPYLKLAQFPFQVEGTLLPYTFLSIDLPSPLPPTAIVLVERLTDRARDGSCGRMGSVLWKPVDARRIAIYSVGCEHRRKTDEMHFRLTVLDKPLHPVVNARKIAD